jgi:hypothetical protein
VLYPVSRYYHMRVNVTTHGFLRDGTITTQLGVVSCYSHVWVYLHTKIDINIFQWILHLMVPFMRMFFFFENHMGMSWKKYFTGAFQYYNRRPFLINTYDSVFIFPIKFYLIIPEVQKIWFIGFKIVINLKDERGYAYYYNCVLSGIKIDDNSILTIWIVPKTRVFNWV